MMDNWRGIMAAFTALGLVTVVIPLMFLGMSSSAFSSGEPVPRPSKPESTGVSVAGYDKAVSTEGTGSVKTSKPDKATGRKATEAGGVKSS